MKRTRLLWKLLASYGVVIGLSLLLTGGYLQHAFKQFYLQQTRLDLTARAQLLSEGLRPLIQAGDTLQIQNYCEHNSHLAEARITVIRPDGLVLGDSQEQPARMDNHAHRDEILPALSGQIGYAVRHSDTIQTTMMYVGMPLVYEGRVIAVVRTAAPMVTVDAAFKRVTSGMLGGMLLILLVAAGFSFGLSRRMARPIERMEQDARILAAGDFTYRLPIPEAEELASLARTFNGVAEQMERRLQTIVQQHNELEAVLSSMLEGVIAVDMQERVINVNQAAAAMFDASQAKSWVGRNIQDMVRNTAFLTLMRDGLMAPEQVEGDVVLFHNQDRILHLRVSALHDGNNHQSGGLIVITDVSQVRRLENMRRDFAANVSHELKTPLTAIKGFVETLLDGALEQPEEARRFLGIIEKHVLRLEAILEDLMRLSHIEQAHGHDEIELYRQPLAPVIEGAAQLCRSSSAEARNIALQTSCPPDLQVVMDRLLMEQALVNLLDNGIKYSHTGGMVQIEAVSGTNEVRITIADEGAGIPAHHIPRLFERFYRVDQARSRRQGGTGLGLAIVKHIVQAHSGRIEVESVVGRGSRFHIFLPHE